MKLTLTVLLLTFSFSLNAQQFFRYKNDAGQTVLNSAIPAEFVDNGYDILDARGQLIERVPPRTQDGVSAEESRLQSERQAEDAVLLASYSTVQEIEAHRERKLDEIRREISIIQSDQRVMGEQLEEVVAEYQELVEDQEEVPHELAQRKLDLESTLSYLDQQLARRESEITQTSDEFELRIRRFSELKDQ